MLVFNHWAYKIAEKIMREKPDGKIVITSGITTSGPAHLGTVIEGLMPNTIKKVLLEYKRDVDFYFIADIMDAFDSVPRDLMQFKEFLEPHLGKPLAFVPDPFSCHDSYAEHFLQEALYVFNAFGINPIVKRAHELYKQGAFEKQTIILINNFERVKEIVEKTSGRTLGKDWHVIMPVCEKCGKIATTTITKWDKEGNYEYICNKDVGYTKGCNYEGKSNIKYGNYKLQWRLHWPSWHYYFNTTAEGGGLDHFTKGGSWDTAKEIHKEIFKRKEPIGYRWGFILEHGRKMSKSKGVILSALELIKLLPPKIIAYHILKYDLEENMNFNPEKESILNIIEDYENASQITDRSTRALEKKAAAYYLSNLGFKDWQGNFRDYLLYYSIYRDWDKVKIHLPYDADKIKGYISYWFDKDFVPEDYNFSYKPEKAKGNVRVFIESLKNDMDALAIHNAVYDFCKMHNINASEFFAEIYKTLIGKNKGPRLGKLIYALGVDRVKRDVL
ncbi:MAG: lysine--tRNA ligase [Candidatus Anstonellales archaeon]